MGKIDSVIWVGNFYFSKGKLIANVTLGHGISEIDSWNPKVGMLKAFNESKKIIQKHHEMKW
jgi:hypothetical protein